jgi:hypothetical protein
MSRRALDLLTIAVAAAFTLLLELALAERKFALFGGGFGALRVLDTPGEIAAFGIGAVAAHVLLMAAVFVLVRRLHRRDRPGLIRFDYLALSVAAFSAALIAKFEVLSYFSDAISFQLIRNLGGGSLFDAFLFALSEGALMIGGAVGALVLWWLVRRIVARRSPVSDEHGPRLRWPMLGLVAALPLLIWLANGLPDARYGLNRMTAYGLANMGLHAATDFDRDGYSWYSAQIDRAPFDAARHPLALDIPGNGVDEDGFGGDLRFTGADPVVAPPRLLSAKKHLVLVVIESTRGDAIGKRINGRLVAPNLTALAAGGSNLPHAYSHVGFTTASLKSLFSGQLEPRTGDPSLFTDLKANGYRIAVFSGQPESFGDISEVTGMQRSADVFVDAETLKAERALGFAAKGSLRIDETILLREFDRRLGGAAGWVRPTFAYLNFQSPHFPYNHPGLPDLLGVKPLPRDAISVENATRVQESYWNAVAYSDAKLGEVIARLKALGVWEQTVLAVTGDHGEALFETGFLGHGHVIDATQNAIPFVLSVPGFASDTPLGLKDMRGLMLQALGGAPAPVRSAPVLMHIGPLDAPAAIGIAETGGRFTTMTLDTEEAWFSDTGLRKRYAELNPAESARTDRLVTEWGRQRWAARFRR